MLKSHLPVSSPHSRVPQIWGLSIVSTANLLDIFDLVIHDRSRYPSLCARVRWMSRRLSCLLRGTVYTTLSRLRLRRWVATNPWERAFIDGELEVRVANGRFPTCARCGPGLLVLGQSLGPSYSPCGAPA